MAQYIWGGKNHAFLIEGFAPSSSSSLSSESSSSSSISSSSSRSSESSSSSSRSSESSSSSSMSSYSSSSSSESSVSSSSSSESSVSSSSSSESSQSSSSSSESSQSSSSSSESSSSESSASSQSSSSSSESSASSSGSSVSSESSQSSPSSSESSSSSSESSSSSSESSSSSRSSSSSSSSSASSSSSGSSSSSSSSSTGPPDYGFRGDIVLDPLLGDIVADSAATKSLSGVDYALESAVLISLFTDKRAKKDDPLPEFDGSRRGWWGDQVFPDVDGDEIGSHLWLLERSKTIPEVLIKAKYYINQALKWMIEDKIVVRYEIEVERNVNSPNDGLFFRVQLYKKDGTSVALNFEGNYGVKLE